MSILLANAVSRQAEAELGSARVLLVDDSFLIREEIARRLRVVGLTVDTVECGEDALAHLEAFGTPDLVVLDILMPGIDGYEVAQRMRADPRYQRVPVLLLTSLDGEKEKLRGLEMGGDDFLTKSAGEAELIARVRSLVALGRMRSRVDSDRQAVRRTIAHQAGPVELVVCVQNTVNLPSDVLERGLGPDTRIRWLAPEALDTRQCRSDMTIVPWSPSLEDTGELSVQRRNGHPDLVVVDERPSSARRVLAYQAGAALYLPAHVSVAEIRARIGGLLDHRRRLRALQGDRDHAVRAATRDALTGLFNRGYLDEVLQTELERARRSEPVCLVMLDVDHFKRVNDTQGHATGDEVLKEIARRANAEVRAGDVVARFGGEEFAVVLPRANLRHALSIAERIRVAIAEQPIKVGERSIHVTASLGVAESHASITVAEWIEAADSALYSAKTAGRNRVICDGWVGEAGVCVAPETPEARLRSLLTDELQSPLLGLFHAVDLLTMASEPGDPLHAMVEVMDERRTEIRSELARILDLLHEQ